MEKLPIVGVMGSGSADHAELSEPLGEWIAREGYHLLTGGGAGVMASVSRAYCSVQPRRGICLGIIPAGPPTGYPNSWIELPIQTHLGSRGRSGMDQDSRNHINILSSDVIVALPGGFGTSSEVRLSQVYQKPLIVFLGKEDEIPDLPADVKISHELEEVKAFVREHIRG